MKIQKKQNFHDRYININNEVDPCFFCLFIDILYILLIFIIIIYFLTMNLFEEDNRRMLALVLAFCIVNGNIYHSL